MVFFLNRHLNPSTPIGPFLSGVCGVSLKKSLYYCNSFGVHYRTKIGQLPSHVITWLNEIITGMVVNETEYKRRVKERIQERLRSGSHRGVRMLQGLPSRGQRGKTNGKTARKLKPKIEND